MDTDIICRICGKPATSFHYGVISCSWSDFCFPTCRGCKAFFRRGVEKKIQFHCYLGNSCSTLASNKVRCKSCRFRKCSALGMKMPDTEPALVEEHTSLLADSPSCSITAKIHDVSNQYRSLKDYCTLNHGDDSSVSLMQIPNGTDPSSSSVGNPDQLLRIPDIPAHVSCLPYASDLITTSIRLSPKMHDNSTNYATSSVNNIYNRKTSQQELMSTIFAVGAAAWQIFGDQISSWTVFMNNAVQSGIIVHQPECSLDEMIKAINQHNIDNVRRSLNFATMLPGFQELDALSQRSVMAPWKWLIFWMIHHAPFFMNGETYALIGSNQLHYGTFWQEMISDYSFRIFIQKFCNELQKVGLDQTERYLLMTVIFLEPDDGLSPSFYLNALHHHYSDALVSVIKMRSTDATLLQSVSYKLDSLFGILKMVQQIFQRYFLDPDTCPRCSVGPMTEVDRMYRTLSWQ